MLAPESRAQKCSRCPAVPEAAGLLQGTARMLELPEIYISLGGSGEAGPLPYAGRGDWVHLCNRMMETKLGMMPNYFKRPRLNWEKQGNSRDGGREL